MNIYNSVPAAHLKRSMFHWRKERNHSQDFGAIVPIFWQEVLPEDVWKINQSNFIRVQPMVAAPFTPMRYYSEFWFFPTRLLMQKFYPEIVDAWATFIFGGPNGDGKNEAGQTPVLPLWIPNKSNVRLAGTNVVDGVQSHKTGNADAKGSLWDYFALPVNQGFHDLSDDGKKAGVDYSAFVPLAFPKIAYNLLWNEFKRNENIESPVALDSDDVQFAKWKHDRFTSSLPFQQRGTPVAMPLGEVAFSSVPQAVKAYQLYAFSSGGSFVTTPLQGDTVGTQASEEVFGVPLNFPTSGRNGDYSPTYSGGQFKFSYNGFVANQKVPIPGQNFVPLGNNPSKDGSYPYDQNVPMNDYAHAFNFGVANKYGLDGQSNYSQTHEVDDSTSVAPLRAHYNNTLNWNTNRFPAYTQANVDVSDLRLMFQTQKFMERAARGGVRYIEGLKSFFGSNMRTDVLQLPQFIGGMKQNIIVNEVLQTSETNETPQGNIAGRGVSAGAENIGVLHAREHGYILGICWIKPDLYYNSQGVNKQHLRRSKFDFYWPQFAHLSEQPIQKCELYADLSLSPAQLGAGIEGTLGYSGIYNEYRSCENEVCGEMRDTFDYWHLSRKFSSAPELNHDFITCFPRKDIFAVQDEDEFLLDMLFDCKIYRPMPIESNPGLLDHF